jgi:hypothetical protein
MNAKRTDPSSSKQPPSSLGLDPDFERALDEFTEASRRTLETLIRERIAALDEQIVALAAKAKSTAALVERATSAEAQIMVLQQQLADAISRLELRGDESLRTSAEVADGTARADRGGRQPARRARESRQEISRNPTLGDVIEFLSRRGFEAQNSRKQGGGVWVFANEEQFAPVLKELKSAGIGTRYFPRGRSLKPGPQYEIDPFKALRD